MNRKNRLMVWGFAALMVAHWMEHIFQAWQVYVMKMPPKCALGMLGMKYPWLVRTESLHFAFAVVTSVGLLALWDVFVNGQARPRSAPWWKAAFWISLWHLFEHALLFGQAALHHNLFGKPAPTSLLQLAVPRVELHLFYNTLVTIPVVVAMVLFTRKRALDGEGRPCSDTSGQASTQGNGRPLWTRSST